MFTTRGMEWLGVTWCWSRNCSLEHFFLSITNQLHAIRTHACKAYCCRGPGNHYHRIHLYFWLVPRNLMESGKKICVLHVSSKPRFTHSPAAVAASTHLTASPRRSHAENNLTHGRFRQLEVVRDLCQDVVLGVCYKYTWGCSATPSDAWTVPLWGGRNNTKLPNVVWYVLYRTIKLLCGFVHDNKHWRPSLISLLLHHHHYPHHHHHFHSLSPSSPSFTSPTPPHPIIAACTSTPRPPSHPLTATQYRTTLPSLLEAPQLQ